MLNFGNMERKESQAIFEGKARNQKSILNSIELAIVDSMNRRTAFAPN